MIVRRAEFAEYLRIDGPSKAELAELKRFLLEAQAVCEDFCRVKFRGSAPEPVKLAVKLLAAHYYAYREGSDPSAETAIRTAAENLIWPYRDESKLF